MGLVKCFMLVGIVGFLSACDESYSIGNGFCGFPIELSGDVNSRSTGYVVSFHSSANVVEEVRRLDQKYNDIEVGSVYGAINEVYVNMGDRSLEEIRCEKQVRHIAYNTRVSLAEND